MFWFYYICGAILISSILQIGPVGTNASRWDQIGNAINGTMKSEYIGYDVDISADGTTVATTSMPETPTASFPETIGKLVHVVKYNASTDQWEPMGSPIVGNEHAKLSGDGTMLIVSDVITLPRKIRVYKFISGRWVQIGADFVAKDYGTKVDISEDGKTIVISEPSLEYGGIVRVYRLLQSPPRWIQIGSDLKNDWVDDIEDWLDAGMFGEGIAISANGTILAIGAPYSGGALQLKGKVRVYKLQSSQSSWVQLGSDIDGAFMEYIGAHISMSSDGTTIALGPDGMQGTGNVSVYQLSSTQTRWIQLGPVIKSNKVLHQSVPTITLSGDGTVLAIGNPNYSKNPYDSSYIEGRVRIYKFNTSRQRWLQMGVDIVGRNNEATGSSISISADGTIIAVGSPLVDNKATNAPDAGQVRIYKLREQRITPPTCNVKWNIYNSRKNTLVGAIRNGTVISRPPPCNYTNVAADISSCNITTTTNTTVLIQLYTSNMKQLIHSRLEKAPKYFLFGNNGVNVYDGRIVPGTYNLVAQINNGQNGNPTTFTIRDNEQCQ